MNRYVPTAAFAGMFLASGATASTFDIVYDPLAPPSESQQALLAEGERYWESLIPAYQPGIDIDAVTIEVGASDVDGEEGTLAFANWIDSTDQGGYVLPTSGFIEFDFSDLDWLEKEDLLFDTLLHETAHVLGFGTLWTANNVYEHGSGVYTGATAIAAYRDEFDPTAATVPVELDGDEGTRNAHWDEHWAGGGDELMTGYLAGPAFLSNTTLQSFRDLGYAPITPTPVPLPAGLWLSLGALGLLGATRRRARN